MIAFGASILIMPVAVEAGEDKNIYKMAVKNATHKQYDFAFMRYRTILNKYPQSKYTQQALFATAEYYYRLGHHQKAAEHFRTYLQRYPDDEAKLFVLAFLYKFADENGKTQEADEYAKQIIELKQVSLVFRDFKKYSYTSPMHRTYTAVFHIDKIELFDEGGRIAGINY